MIDHSQIVTEELISHAISAGIRLGQVFEISVSDDGKYVDEIGLRSTKEFIDEWWHCFEDSKRKPKKNRSYIAVAYSSFGDCGAYLVEI